MSYGELWGKNFEALYLRAQMKFLIKIFFSHHAQHLNFDLKKDLGHSDRWKKTGTLKSFRPAKSLRNRIHIQTKKLTHQNILKFPEI